MSQEDIDEIFMHKNSAKRYLFCVEKCFSNFSRPLKDGEKVCLAQCADRTFERYNSVFQDLKSMSEDKKPL